MGVHHHWRYRRQVAGAQCKLVFNLYCLHAITSMNHYFREKETKEGSDFQMTTFCMTLRWTMRTKNGLTINVAWHPEGQLIKERRVTGCHEVTLFWIAPRAWLHCAETVKGTRVSPFNETQGGHGTGKTGNLVLTFSRQGKHREFCFDTGKNSETQGKYFFVTQGKI